MTQRGFAANLYAYSPSTAARAMVYQWIMSRHFQDNGKDVDKTGSNGSARAPRPFHFLVIGLLVLAGILVSTIAFNAIQNQESQAAATQFHLDAKNCHVALERELSINLDLVKAAQAFYNSSVEVTRAEFHEFTAGQLRGSSIQAIEWSPRVPDAERVKYESLPRQEGFPQFRFTERTSQGEIVQAGRREEYFPVYFVEPLRGNEKAAGYDLASETTRQAAMKRAQETGQMTCTGRITLVQETGRQYGFLVFAPVYRQGAALESVEARRNHLSGFVLGVFRAGALVADAVSHVTTKGVSLEVHDLNGPPSESFMCCVPPGRPGEPDPQAPEVGAKPRGEMCFQTSLAVADRVWRVRYTPSTGAAYTVDSVSAWVVLFAGIFLSVLVGHYLLANVRHAERIERVVRERTVKLQDEIRIRRHAETTLEESEARYRLLLESTAEGIYGIDMAGNCTFVNPACLHLIGCTRADELLGKNMHWQIHSKRPDGTPYPVEECRIYHAFEKGEGIHVDDEVFWRADGTCFPVEYWSYPQRQNGVMVGAVVAFIDIASRKQAERAMKESEESTRAITDSARDAILMADAEGRVSYWNPAAERILGYTRAEALGRNLHELLAPARYLEAHHAAFPAFQQTGLGAAVGKTLDLEARRKDGTEIPIQLSLSTVHKSDGWHAVGILRDVTEQKQADERERGRRHIFEMLAANTPLSKIMDFIVRLVEKEVPDCLCTVLLADRNGKRLLHGAAPGLPDFYNQAVNGLEIGDGAGSCGTAAFIKKTVIVEDVETHCYWAAFRELARRAGVRSCWSEPILSVTGEILGTFAIYHREPHSPCDADIQRLRFAAAVASTVIERTQKEEQLRNLWSAVEQSPVVVMIADKDAKIEYVNPYFTMQTGYALSEVIGRNPRFLQSGAHAPDFYKAMWGTLLADKTWRGELCNKRKDGTIFWEQTAITTVRDRNGERTHFVAVKEDITERRRIHEELRQAKETADAASRAKSEFLAKMSHEIRTPMNAMLGYAQLLQRDSSLSAAAMEKLEIINRSGGHLLQLINDVLEMSKIEAGRLTVNPKAFDLASMLADLAAMFRLRTEAKRLGFEMAVTDPIPARVMADEAKVRQVLVNLLGNAVKFTACGGVILRASATKDGEGRWRLAVEVEDTGPGIAAEQQEKLFQRFEQADSGRDTTSGTGLGLAISRQYARAMGGDITLSSVVNKGSVFRFTMPIVETDVDAGLEKRIAPRQVVGLKTGHPPIRVLVVDDHPENRHWLCSLLTVVGFQTREAANGTEAVRIWEEWKPQLVLMDMLMPGLDGYETARQIRALPQGDASRILAVTASVFDKDANSLRDLGLDDLLRKPVKESELFETIQKHLRVDYLYAEAALPPPAAGRVASYDPAALAKLPDELVAQMRAAAESGKTKQLRQLIQQAAGYDEPLARMLRGLSDQYEYEALLAILSEGKTP